MKKTLAAAFLCLASTVQAAPTEDMPVAVLRTIDKISARTSTFDIPVGRTVQFGSSLYIKVRACRANPPLESPESAAFLQIWEKKPDDRESRWVFSGWMFASRPALSAMDHPVYDVWVIDCKNSSTPAKPETFSSEKAPETAPAAETPAGADGAPPNTGD